MSESSTHTDLYTKSGCLTTESLKGYLSDKLSGFDKEQVKVHLESCELCSDALDGLQLLSEPGKLDSIVSEINKNLRTTINRDVKKIPPEESKLKNRFYYVAAAASVLILFGLFLYLKIYLKNESAKQSVSQLTDIEKKSIPPMPEVQTPAIIAKSEKQAQKPEKEKKTVKKETPNELPDKTKTTDKTETSQSARKATEGGKLSYVAPLKAIRASEGIHESLVINEFEMATDSALKTEDRTATDIASTQPIEYYIGGVVVYDKAIGPANMAALSAEPGTMSGRASKYKKTDAIHQMAESDSKMGNINEKQGDNVIEEQSAFVNEEGDNSKNHFFSLGNEVPQFPGGYEALIEYLNRNLSYPKEARQRGLQGKVLISFIVGKTGEVSSVSIIRGIGGGCDEEVVRVIESMPDWQPANKGNKPVSVKMVIPVCFKLN